MKLFYITVETPEQAKAISLSLLEKRMAACINWFPISSAYRWDGEIKQESEVVLIVKTKEDMREKIEKIVSEHISYTNFMAELDVASVNAPFLSWLGEEVQG